MTENTNLIDLLIYLFETYTHDNTMVYTNPDLVANEIVQAGLKPQEAQKVLNWFKDLQVVSKQFFKNTKAIRVFAREERSKIALEGRNFLLYLEHIGILDHDLRELLIARAMKSKINIVDDEDLKWILFHILFKESYQTKLNVQLLASLILENEDNHLPH